MKKRLSGYICLIAGVFYLAQPCVCSLMAQGAQGEPIVVGGDLGEPVDDSAPPAEKGGSGIWPWVAGAMALIAGGLGGYLIADNEDDDDDDDDDAGSGGSGAGGSGDDASGSGSGDDASGSGSGDDASGSGDFAYTVFITGTFRGDTIANYNSTGTNFTPSIDFAVAHGDIPGGIRDYVSSSTFQWSGLGGDYTQVSDRSILITVDDVFYLGTATRLDEKTLKLHNQRWLKGVGDAGIYLHINP